MNMYEGDELVITDATCPNRLKVKLLFGRQYCCRHTVSISRINFFENALVVKNSSTSQNY